MIIYTILPLLCVLACSSSLLTFERNILGEWITEDVTMGDGEPVLFVLGAPGTPLRVAGRPTGTLHRGRFKFGPNYEAYFDYRTVEPFGVAKVTADLFTLLELLAARTLIVSLADTLQITLVPKSLENSKDVAHWVMDGLPLGPLKLDMSEEGIRFPMSKWSAFADYELRRGINGYIWIWKTAAMVPIPKLVSIGGVTEFSTAHLTRLAGDSDGFVKSTFSISDTGEDSVHIGELLLRTVHRVTIEDIGRFIIDHRKNLYTAKVSHSLRHLPIFHPPVFDTNVWGDSILCLYPARYPLPAGSRLALPCEGVVTPNAAGSFKFLGAMDETDFLEWTMRGSVDLENKWEERRTVCELLLGRFHLEKVVAKDMGGGSIWSLAVSLQSDGVYHWEVQPKLDIETDPECLKEDCSICFLTLDTPSVHGLRKCGHCYHAKCLRRWALQASTCPICRKSMLLSERPKTLLEQLRTGTRKSLRGPTFPALFAMIYILFYSFPALFNAITASVPLDRADIFNFLLLAGFLLHRICIVEGFAILCLPRAPITVEYLPPQLAIKVKQWIKS